MKNGLAMSEMSDQELFDVNQYCLRRVRQLSKDRVKYADHPWLPRVITVAEDRLATVAAQCAEELTERSHARPLPVFRQF